MSKPTRADLLAALESLQGLIGMASAVAGNDRDMNRAAKLHDYLTRAFDLCCEARAYDAPKVRRRSRFANLDTKSNAV